MSNPLEGRTLTVGQLKTELALLNDDDLVCVAADRGDYHHTMQAITITRAEEAFLVKADGYSSSGWALSSNQYPYDDEAFNNRPFNELDEEDKEARPSIICLNCNVL